MKIKPPLTVTGMVWAVLILAVWNLFRLGSTLANWTLLLEFAPRPGPWYVALSASFWTLACLAVWWAIRHHYQHSQGVHILVIFGFAAWWWADRYLFSQVPHPNTWFAAILTAIILASALVDFFNPNATDYFTKRETYEQPTDQQSSQS